MNGFNLITNQETCKRILVHEGLADLHREIKGDGFAHVPFQSRDHYMLVVCYKAPDGTVDYRIATVHKSVRLELAADTFSEIIAMTAEATGYGVRAKVENVAKN